MVSKKLGNIDNENIDLENKDQEKIALKEKITAISKATTHYIHENPVKAVGFSMLVGLGVGILMKLRK